MGITRSKEKVFFFFFFTSQSNLKTQYDNTIHNIKYNKSAKMD